MFWGLIMSGWWLTGVWSLFPGIGEAHAYIAGGQKGFELSPQVHRPPSPASLQGDRLCHGTWRDGSCGRFYVMCSSLSELLRIARQGHWTPSRKVTEEDLGIWCGCTCLLVCSWAGSTVRRFSESFSWCCDRIAET